MSFSIDLVDKYRRSLRSKLDQESVNGAELLEGIRECFVLTQRQFVSQRRPDLSTDDVFKLSGELVDDVYREEGIAPERIVLTALERAVHKLNARFEFSQDPELTARHDAVIKMIIAKADQNDLLNA